ncbi:MAG: mechanosensitive ion channel family protein [Bacteroidetes bacterium]|nr:mechanosensitive ion channel family protein [Bacteroidota bacterium]
MRKVFVLLVKAAVFFTLLMIRLGEWDLHWMYEHTRYRKDLPYYINTLSGLILFLILLDFVQFFTTRWYRVRHKIKGDDNFIVGVNQIYSLLLFIGVFAGILSLFQINVKELFTSLSIIFAGLAILTKDYISNMINGMIITFAGQLSIGDNVKIGRHRGKITAITLQNIHLLNDDDDMIYIPNNFVNTTDVVNYTKREIKRTSIDFEIALRHLKNVEELEHQLVESLRPFHDLINADSYYLRVAEVRKDNVSLKFQYILKEPNKDLERQIRRKAIRRLVELISEREKIVDELPELPDDLGHNII